MKKLLMSIILASPFAVYGSQNALEKVIVSKLSGSSEHVGDLKQVADRERVRSWLPDAPTVTYSMGDNQTWKAWTVSTSLPIPVKSLYRDSYTAASGKLMKAEANQSKQEMLREAVETYLECFMPREMITLLGEALRDQNIMTSVSSSLYATGAIPQADRVASELQLRQLEAQVNAQNDLMSTGCARWTRWGGEITDENESSLVSTISNEALRDLDLVIDARKDVVIRKFETVSLDKKNLWSKYIPDLELSYSKNNYFDLYRSGGPPVKYTDSWSVGIKLPFAFPFYDNSDYKRESAELGIAKMKLEFEKTETLKTWELAKKDWKRTLNRLTEIEGKDLALAEAFVESALASYRQGKVGLAELALARRTKLDLKIEQVNLKAQKLIAKTVCLTECEL